VFWKTRKMSEEKTEQLILEVEKKTFFLINLDMTTKRKRDV